MGRGNPRQRFSAQVPTEAAAWAFAWSQLQADRDALRARVQKLTEALEEALPYVRHASFCGYDGEFVCCSCGALGAWATLRAALSEESPDPAEEG